MIPGRLTAAALIRHPVGAGPIRQRATVVGGMSPRGEAGARSRALGKPEPPTGFIILRLRRTPRGEIPVERERLGEFAKRAGLDHLARVIDQFDLEGGQPLVRSVPANRLLELEARAAQSALPPLRSLTAYWRLDLRDRADRIDEVLKVLNATPGVDRAYAEVPMGDPAVNPGDDDYNGQQDYLDAAPVGIDARWAWTQPNGEGAGIAVIDMEQGWLLGHEDYAAKAPAVVAGDNRDGVGTYVGNHGCAVLGEMIADDNDRGVVGIAPSAGPVRCASHYDAGTNTNGHVADAVVGAIANLAAGDVLVIEAQTVPPDPFGAPAEYVDDSFDAIRLASALGIIVFEAAGNGDNDLDTLTNGGLEILNPASADFRESGAIMVGAATPALPHDREGFSSFGARVDCYAWGNGVVTSGYGDLDGGGGNEDLTYTDTFSGTSSATPIVAGAGLIVQGMHAANTGARLSPQVMRLLLSDPATGTPQGPNVAGNIGVMPDLRAIIEDTLGLSADVYLRDNLADTGNVPTTGDLSSSPDIIVRPVAVADPTASFGEGSGTENDSGLGYEVESGQDNFLYVRMQNRGAADAQNVTARIFWSPPSTLVTPDLWTEIGVTAPVDVPQGDTLVVTPALTWPSAEIPGTGHYCFVGILSHPTDPAPPTPPATDWNGFLGFISGQNNVAWRNFNVVDNLDDPNADPYAAPFLMANAPGARRRFDFVIEQRLGRGVQAALEVPLAILKPFTAGVDLNIEIDRKRKVAIIALPGSQRLTAPRVLLPAQARLACRFILRGLPKFGRVGNSIAIAQRFEGREVGRVTWRFAKRRDPKAEAQGRLPQGVAEQVAAGASASAADPA